MAEVVLVVGTQKAVFVLRSPDRRRFRLSEPRFSDEEVYSVGVDSRSGAPRLFAGCTSQHWGTIVRCSEDLGQSWSDPPVGNVSFPAVADANVAHVWQIQPAGPAQPDVIYAGVEPAALFRSDDGGRSFSLVAPLWHHPHRPRWQPGFGGLCLHSVVVHRGDPSRVRIAISAAGVYATDDGGGSWRAANQGIHLPNEPDQFPEFGQCVHRIAPDPVADDTLFLQNHGGLYRSDDFGNSWRDIANGVPSDFGFPVATHPRRRGVAYVVPLTADYQRWPVRGRCRVYRTSDGGASWEPLSAGLPQRSAYFSVLRDALCTDSLDPAGVYFGTRSGEVYASADEGETWRRVASHLPPVLSVRAAAVA
ncbi:MAG: exo-alpha-sialidase [Actinobacteria bacterium]|nr:MAG: exo-alpha-sialidase [Actinomycetota bacterium]